ncbi:unnamed protein product [Triticum turgidum subsp. durum]|uniref:F-box domain-containing protein n=1 Tax=Triticum turgidum subsp. durum TaxID=4567 RepID=A0A9R1SA04_TRITD|nr:unnamed protein product [Triticum turgidum subsp. durum]
MLHEKPVQIGQLADDGDAANKAWTGEKRRRNVPPSSSDAPATAQDHGDMEDTIQGGQDPIPHAADMEPLLRTDSAQETSQDCFGPDVLISEEDETRYAQLLRPNIPLPRMDLPLYMTWEEEDKIEARLGRLRITYYKAVKPECARERELKEPEEYTDAELGKELYFKRLEEDESFEWFVHPDDTYKAGLNDYQRIAPRNFWFDKDTRAWRQALKIATGFPHMTVRLAAFAYNECILEMDKDASLKDIDLLYFEIWRRVAKKNLSYMDAVKEVYEMDKFDVHKRRLDGELKGVPAIATIKEYMHYVVRQGGIDAKTEEDKARDVFRKLSVSMHKAMNMAQYAQKKLDLADELKLDKEEEFWLALFKISKTESLLIVSRCVCRTWRAAIVDAHDVLLPCYFPRHVFPGIFVTKVGCHTDAAFFAPPPGTRAADRSDFWRPVSLLDRASVLHSCNGLLLLEDRWRGYLVCNPATARFADLTLPKMSSTCHVDAMFLAFYPAVSLQYEVFLFQEEYPPRVPEPPTWVDLEQTYLPNLFEEEQLSQVEDENMDLGHVEQPQEEGVEEQKEKVVPLTVYSSHTGHWENREFTPGCCAPGHLYDAVTTSPDSYEKVWSSEYWHGSLYVYCHNSALMILRPSKWTYDMVQLPGEPCATRGFYSLPKNSVLASYERGIHCVAFNQPQLKVWKLTESIDGQLGWALAHEASLNPQDHITDHLTIEPRVKWGVVESSDELVNLFEDRSCGESMCSEDYCHDDYIEDESYEGVKEEDEGQEEEEEEGHEVEDARSIGGSEHSWNSDEDNFIHVDGDIDHLGPLAWSFWNFYRIMGFHPHKNALILLLHSMVVVYHLDMSRMQYLGDKHELIKDHFQQACCAYRSFPYRPCYVDALLTGDLS